MKRIAISAILIMSMAVTGLMTYLFSTTTGATWWPEIFTGMLGTLTVTLGWAVWAVLEDLG